MTSRSKEPASLLAAAREYAARGWAVFPLKPRDKAPLTKNGVLDASTDRNQVLQWWQLFPDANIGLKCGDPFDVLDIDGPESVPALQEILGHDYRHSGPVARTGRGKHLYFQSIEEGRNRAGLLGGKLDYRGTGGYVVGPPSIHPSGARYDWDGQRGLERPLPVVPEVLANIIRPPINRHIPRYAIDRGPDGLLLTRTALLAVTRPPILETVEGLGGIVTTKGRNFYTNCFFHHDPGPSMALYTADDSFFCYGCEAHGDSLNLLQHRDINGREFV